VGAPTLRLNTPNAFVAVYFDFRGQLVVEFGEPPPRLERAQTAAAPSGARRSSSPCPCANAPPSPSPLPGRPVQATTPSLSAMKASLGRVRRRQGPLVCVGPGSLHNREEIGRKGAHHTSNGANRDGEAAQGCGTHPARPPAACRRLQGNDQGAAGAVPRCPLRQRRRSGEPALSRNVLVALLMVCLLSISPGRGNQKKVQGQRCRHNSAPSEPAHRLSPRLAAAGCGAARYGDCAEPEQRGLPCSAARPPACAPTLSPLLSTRCAAAMRGGQG
jgi:hypothetical protein